MPLNIRFNGDVVILSNLGRLMNDPRYTSAGAEVAELSDQGYRKFVLELSGLRDLGSSLLGVLMTLTRTIRSRGGEIVLARPSRGVESFLEEMRLEGHWDIFEAVEDAEAFFREDEDRGVSEGVV